MSGVIAKADSSRSERAQVLIKGAPYEVSQLAEPDSLPHDWGQVGDALKLRLKCSVCRDQKCLFVFLCIALPLWPYIPQPYFPACVYVKAIRIGKTGPCVVLCLVHGRVSLSSLNMGVCFPHIQQMRP